MSKIHSDSYKYLIGLGVMLLLYGLSNILNHSNEWHREEIIVHGKPKVLRSKGSSWYSIETNNKKCDYEIIGGAYEIISQSAEKEKLIQDIKCGQKIEVLTQTGQSEYSRRLNCAIKIYGISVDGVKVVDVEETLKTEAKTRNVVSYIGFIIILAGIALRIFK